MNHKTAKKWDRLFTNLAPSGKAKTFVLENFYKMALYYSFSQQESNHFLSTCIAKGFVKHLEHPSIPEHDFGIYTVTNQGIAFISEGGGFSRLVNDEYLSRRNQKFSLFRHWLWFLFFLISLVWNILFLTGHSPITPLSLPTP